MAFTFVAQAGEHLISQNECWTDHLVERNDRAPSAGHWIVVLKEHLHTLAEEFLHAGLNLASQAVVLPEAVRDDIHTRGQNLLDRASVRGPDKGLKQIAADLGLAERVFRHRKQPRN